MDGNGPYSWLSGPTGEPTLPNTRSDWQYSGSTLVQGWHWYGFENLVICPQCWATFASSTPLATLAPIQNIPIAEPRMCCLYSPRMRSLWVETGTNGPSAVQQLLDFSLMRLDGYSATLMLQRNQAMHLGQMSNMYQGMEGMKAINGMADGYQYGDDQLGCFRPEHGVTSALFEAEQRTALARADDPGMLAMIAQLEARWRAVEKGL